MTGPEIRRLTTEIRAELSELAKVKAVLLVCHAYGHELDWERIRGPLGNLGVAYADFVEDVGEFLHFLEAMAEE